MKRKICQIGILFLVTGCAAHSHREGTIVFTDSVKEAHACINHKGLRAGDEVNVYKGVCKSESILEGERGIRNRTSCKKEFLGKGRILELSDEHFARIEATGDLSLERGHIVEALQK